MNDMVSMRKMRGLEDFLGTGTGPAAGGAGLGDLLFGGKKIV